MWYAYLSERENDRKGADAVTLTNEDLLAIADLMKPLENDIQGLKADVQGLKTETQELNKRTSNIELTLENETNRNIKLLAENHVNLIDKLNQAIEPADKLLMYEVQLSGFRIRLEHLEKEVAELKNNNIA